MKFFTLTAIFLSLLITGFTASGKEVFPEIPEEKETLLIQLQTEWYDSIANYKDLGKFSRLPHKNSFQYLSLDPRIKYSPWRWLSIDLFGGLMYNRVKIYKSSENKYKFPWRFWFTSVGMGLSFHKKFQDLYLTVGIKGRAPLNRFENTTEHIVSGDGAYHIEPDLWIIYTLSPHFAWLFYNTSFRFRTNKLSALSYHRIGGWIQTRHIDTGLSVNGFFPVISDGYTQRPETRWNVLDKRNGGNYKFYSVNPAVLAFTLWMNFKPLQYLGIQVYGSLDTYGKSYGKGYTIGLLTSGKWHFKSTKSFFKKELKRFKRSEDGDVDEELEEFGEKLEEDEMDEGPEEKNLEEEIEEESDEELEEEESQLKKPAIKIEITDEINKLQ